MLWKKKTYATTYQVKYAANPSFNKARKVSANKKNSRLTTKKLKKKTYYFQIRYSYKKGGVKSWSAWSKVKKIKFVRIKNVIKIENITERESNHEYGKRTKRNRRKMAD